MSAARAFGQEQADAPASRPAEQARRPRRPAPRRRSAIGVAEPRRAAAGAGMPVEARLEHGRARRQTRHPQRGDQARRGRSPGSAAADVRRRRARRPRAPGPARTGPTPDRSAGCSRGSLTRCATADRRRCRRAPGRPCRAAKRVIALPRPSRPTSSTSSRSLVVLVGARRSRASAAARRLACFAVDTGTGRCRAPLRTMANSGWASSGRRFGRGATQADLDHPVGHRDDVVDRAQRVLERVAAARRRADRLSIRATCSAVILRPSGHSVGGEAEDVAQAVVADVPALGEAARRYCRRRRTGPGPGRRSASRTASGARQRRRARGRAACGCARRSRSTLTAPSAAVAARRRRPSASAGEDEQARSRRRMARAFNRKARFSKRLDISRSTVLLR